HGRAREFQTTRNGSSPVIKNFKRSRGAHFDHRLVALNKNADLVQTPKILREWHGKISELIGGKRLRRREK
ncbi:MAG: hypothetical protein HY767_00880, partial [Candidatus Omnitrophica bacterium]|nr:hypothetical protein [Candidatus Omnitrophota bacterium]